jgi:hypothetical protein
MWERLGPQPLILAISAKQKNSRSIVDGQRSLLQSKRFVCGHFVEVLLENNELFQ